MIDFSNLKPDNTNDIIVEEIFLNFKKRNSPIPECHYIQKKFNIDTNKEYLVFKELISGTHIACWNYREYAEAKEAVNGLDVGEIPIFTSNFTQVSYRYRFEDYESRDWE